ncbi:MAG: ABC transporter ATP-binding protein [Pseudochelatococcus sp.]|jgi:ABC-type uncharacterized transport system ATPase subunit|uniref:ABC transporter ATP-binding protein n=1 Tax=Pseudochelatococcus sp. TaxID=2020869 RepID=UPI003D924867
MNAPCPAVALAGIGKSYPGVCALAGVDLALWPGEVHVLLGENGAGKSTLAAILSGMRQPDAGEIRIDGVPRRIGSPREALRRGIGTVFQHAQLVPTLSLVENAALGGPWWRPVDRRGLAARLQAAARLVDPHFALDTGRLAGSLTPGERQRVEIARALMRGSRVLMLDEPTAMLSPQEVAKLGELMRRLAAQGLAVGFVTHKLDEARDFGDRITILRRGRKVAEIAPLPAGDWRRETARDRLVRLMFDADEAGAPEDAPAPGSSLSSVPVLRVEGLAADDPVMPLAGIDLALAAGEILGIAGIEGNGQRQLAEALAGQRPATAGTVTLDGAPLGRLNAGGRYRRGLRHVSDDRLGEGSVGALSVALNLLLKRIGDAPFWRGGVARPAAIAAHARAAIAAFDIRTPGPHAPVGTLSGGNVQKVVLARELAGGARAIVFANPTHGLDLRATAATRRRIREAAAAGLAVLLISTDLDELLELAHAIAVMRGGRIVARLANGEGARERVGALLSDRGGGTERAA